MAITWQRQAQIDTRPTPATAAESRLARSTSGALNLPAIQDPDFSTPTLLRVFSHLLARAHRTRTEFVNALMHYVPTAVAIGYVNDEPDIDLPLPGPDFAKRIGTLLTAASAIRPATRQHPTAPRLKARTERTNHAVAEGPEVEKVVRGHW